MKRKLITLLALLCIVCLLPLSGPAFGSEAPEVRLHDESGVLDELEEAYLNEELNKLNTACAGDVAIVLTRNETGKKLKNAAESAFKEYGFGFGKDRSGMLLLIDTQRKECFLYTSGSMKKAFTQEELDDFVSSNLFPAFIEEGDWADGCDDFITCAGELISSEAQQMNAEFFGVQVTASGGKDIMTVEVNLTNYSQEKLNIADCVSISLLMDGKEYRGALSFKYKSVYSLETLQGTVSFTLPERKSYEDAGPVLTAECCLAQYEYTPEAIEDLREAEKTVRVEKNGSYTSKEEVAAYLRTYGKLPPNYITKQEAQRLGWNASSGNLWDVAPGRSIGGDRFGNYEGLLPGGSYTECDIGYEGGYRDSRRLVFRKSGNEWQIYYTEDHYNSFEEVK